MPSKIAPRPGWYNVAAVATGNALEFYDFLTFSFFAVQIGHSFFPASRTSHGLLYTLATFGVGFLARPLGGVVIGRYGDRVGRKPAMLLSFGMMGAGIAGVALTPSYARIGIAAPILLAAFRLVQGFALGGEVGPSTAFLLEAAPPHRRGLFLSFQAASQYAAILAAGLMGAVLSAVMPASALDAWGWRVAFLAGLAIVPAGLLMRRRLPETVSAPEIGTATAGGRASIRLIVLSLLMIGCGTIGTYSLNYLAVYAQDTLKMPAASAFGSIVVSGVVGIVSCILAGLLSDRIGRRPLMLTAVAAQIVLVVPAFFVMNASRNVLGLYAMTALLGIVQNFTDVPVLTLITEALPKSVRSGALSIIYATSVAVFGGSTQFVVKALLDATGNPLAPAWYMTSALLVGATAMFFMADTRAERGQRAST